MFSDHHKFEQFFKLFFQKCSCCICADVLGQVKIFHSLFTEIHSFQVLVSFFQSCYNLGFWFVPILRFGVMELGCQLSKWVPNWCCVDRIVNHGLVDTGIVVENMLHQLKEMKTLASLCQKWKIPFIGWRGSGAPEIMHLEYEKFSKGPHTLSRLRSDPKTLWIFIEQIGDNFVNPIQAKTPRIELLSAIFLHYFFITEGLRLLVETLQACGKLINSFDGLYAWKLNHRMCLEFVMDPVAWFWFWPHWFQGTLGANLFQDLCGSYQVGFQPKQSP